MKSRNGNVTRKNHVAKQYNYSTFMLHSCRVTIGNIPQRSLFFKGHYFTKVIILPRSLFYSVLNRQVVVSHYVFRGCWGAGVRGRGGGVRGEETCLRSHVYLTRSSWPTFRDHLYTIVTRLLKIVTLVRPLCLQIRINPRVAMKGGRGGAGRKITQLCTDKDRDNNSLK